MRVRDLIFIIHSPARAFASYDISIICANSDPGDKVNYFALQRYEDCAKDGFWKDPSIDGKARWDSSKRNSSKILSLNYRANLIIGQF